MRAEGGQVVEREVDLCEARRLLDRLEESTLTAFMLCVPFPPLSTPLSLLEVRSIVPAAGVKQGGPPRGRERRAAITMYRCARTRLVFAHAQIHVVTFRERRPGSPAINENVDF